MRCTLLLLAGVVLTSTAMASEVGLLRPANQIYSTSIVYEQYKRDVTQRIAAYNGGGDFDGEQKEARLMIRLAANPRPYLGFVFDVGVSDADGSEGYAPMLGIGGHYIVHARDTVAGAVFGQIHHVTDIEYKNEYDRYLSTSSGMTFYGHVWDERKESYFEYDVGAEVSKDFYMLSGRRFSFYGGFMLSFLQSEGEETAQVHASDQPTSTLLNSFSDDGLDFDADSPAAVFVGFEFAEPTDQFGLRAEGRFLKQASFSVAAFSRF